MRVLSLFLITVLTISCNSSPCKSRNPELINELSVFADSIATLISKYHYNQNELEESAYLEITNKVGQLVNDACSKDDFMDKFNTLWQNGPFSHVRLNKMERKANEIAHFIDSLVIGERGAFLEWDNNTAILTVNTMTGVDTKERISEAYKAIDDKGANALIVDLRNNTGGTFAGVPLVGHLLKDSVDAGVFVSKEWWKNNDEIPNINNIENLNPWFGWSIRSFWKDVQEQPLTRIKFEPFQPYFEGDVFVLISAKTASAAEFTADALGQLDNITLIGETTSGQMLSQKMYDLPFGYQIGIPIADYYSFKSGRIEGVGVKPDIEINPVVAINLAKSLASGKSLEIAMEDIKVKLDKLNDQPLSGEVLFLMGSMNEWGKDQKRTPQFEYMGDGVYQVTMKIQPGSHEFKIAPMSWKFDYGANDDNETITINEMKELTRKSGSPNLEVQFQEKSIITITIYVNKNLEADLLLTLNS
ncbi:MULTISPECIES: S41 family peptidase [Flavobacteriaceae]|uniref:S41 family peptidase n=1 Tax=Flavobacteriaceae TaxID=49546 RepID=UPI0014920C97|nr:MULTISPECIES: S41 family peptidase [Allomuricauda]MDC6366657.1 S41 family peptidase [Muricauda sp. AC10]